MKRKVFFAAIVFLLILIISPSIVSAHFPQTDGNITAVLHIEPNDSPIPGQESNILFIFSDQTNKFNLAKCECIVSVSFNKKEILSSFIYPSDSIGIYSESLPIVFPSKGIYTIELSGFPERDSVSGFQPFNLTWQYDVNRAFANPQTTVSSSQILLPVTIAITSTIAIFLIIFIVMKVLTKFKQNQKPL